MSDDVNDPVAPLRLERRTVAPGALLVTVAGELDNATAPEVTRYLRENTDATTSELALDLSGVTFLASSGVQTLVAAWTSDHGVDGRLHLVAPSDPVHRVLSLLSMSAQFPVHGSVPDFLSAVGT